jgi:DNA-binding Lrp family transcriptional regulator
MSKIDERVLERIRRDAGATSAWLLASDLGLKITTVKKAVERLIRAGRVELAEDGFGLRTTVEEAREHHFNVEADRRYKSAVDYMGTKKSPAQLQREIDEILTTKNGNLHAARRTADVILHPADDGTYAVLADSSSDAIRRRLHRAGISWLLGFDPKNAADRAEIERRITKHVGTDLTIAWGSPR